MGHSLGCGIAWNLQKDSPAEIRPGFYAAGGTYVARQIMPNYVFQTIVQQAFGHGIDRIYSTKGYSEEDIRTIWSELQKPPTSGFVLLNSCVDTIIPRWQILPPVKDWRRQGMPMRFRTLPRLGHAGMKQWLLGNIPEMIKHSHKLEAEKRFMKNTGPM